MPEQVICNIVRPQIGVSYVKESPEAEDSDEIAACFLSIWALANRIKECSDKIGKPVPDIITYLAGSEIWRHGD
jgi:hypothetical protein